MTQGQLAGATNKTASIWSREYLNEPYEVQYQQISTMFQYEPHSKYDLLAAAARWRWFFYHVAMPHYQSGPFLEGAMDRFVHVSP